MRLEADSGFFFQSQEYCWEYWVADDNEENIEQCIYEDDFAPMTKVIKDLMEKHHISPHGFDILEPDLAYFMMVEE